MTTLRKSRRLSPGKKVLRPNSLKTKLTRTKPREIVEKEVLVKEVDEVVVEKVIKEEAIKKVVKEEVVKKVPTKTSWFRRAYSNVISYLRGGGSNVK